MMFEAGRPPLCPEGFPEDLQSDPEPGESLAEIAFRVVLIRPYKVDVSVAGSDAFGREKREKGSYTLRCVSAELGRGG